MKDDRIDLLHIQDAIQHIIAYGPLLENHKTRAHEYPPSRSSFSA